MAIDERELRARLEETAARAAAPSFTAADLAGRVRRIRRRRTRGLVLAATLVPAVVAAVTIPLLRGSGVPPGTTTAPFAAPPGPSYMVTVNGQTSVVPSSGPPGSAEYYVTPREKLTITVVVTLRAQPRTTGLSIGISDGVLGPPMSPVLAVATRGQLRPGVHRFTLHWTVPAGLGPDSIRLLATDWSWSGQAGAENKAIAEFAPRPGPAFAASAVRRLRAAALSDAGSCNDPRPASIIAVRTTLAKASTAEGDRDYGQPGQAVYLLVMTGEFISRNGRMPACLRPSAGHYFYDVIDASTFGPVSRWVTNRPPQARLQALGPVANLTP
jgi:hypothetical protein